MAERQGVTVGDDGPAEARAGEWAWGLVEDQELEQVSEQRFEGEPAGVLD